MADKPKITIEHIYERCTHQIFARGKAYYENGTIRNTEWDDEKITARCLGSHAKPYRVEAKLDDKHGIIWASCTCPYDYGGDCKHIVALLLTYLNRPKRFTDKKANIIQPPSDSPLMSRSKGELVIIIQQMLDRYPDLQEIVDDPFPQQAPAGFDVTPLRDELSRAFRRYRNNYDEERAARKIDHIRQQADNLCQAQKWDTSALIYGAILEEFGTSQYILPGYFDPIGFFKTAIDDVLNSVMICLQQLKPSPNRSALLKGMVALWTWQSDRGNSDIGEIVQRLLYDTIGAEDVPGVRVQIQEAHQRQKKHPSSGIRYWQQKKYDDFLRILDLIARQDEVAFIQELYAQGFLTVYIHRLLKGGQIEKATQVLDEKSFSGEQLVGCLQIFDMTGHRTTALRLAQDSMNKGFDGDVIHWALASCRRNEKEDIGSLVLWLIYQFRYTRQMQDYHALKKTAKSAEMWDTVYSQVIAGLQQSGDDELLFQVYLNDKKWNPAWQLLPKLVITPDNLWDLKVAQASREDYPERAIPVYLKYAHQHIRQRNRENYAIAAGMLAIVQVLYESQDDYELWEKQIRHIRTEYKTLRALHEELKRVGLD